MLFAVSDKAMHQHSHTDDLLRLRWHLATTAASVN